MTICKEDFMEAVSERTNFRVQDVEKIINTALDEIGDRLASGDAVRLTGFGTFDVRTTVARTYYGLDDKAVSRPETKHAHFKAGANLKRAAQGGKK